jgi:trehalose 6-phosphate phosphatase
VRAIAGTRRTVRGVYQDTRVPPPTIEELASDPAGTGLFLDFDGTLSEIAPTPEDARAIAGLGPVLERLDGRYGVVAVVTGRPARQVAALIEAPVRIYGLYGTEDAGGGPSPDAPDALPEIERAAAYVPGARVERKGGFAAVHYRAAPDHEAARRILLERLAAVAARHGLAVIEGKRVVEVVGAAAPDKGLVVERVAVEKGLRRVLVAGDDLADLGAFAAVVRLAGAGVAGLRVAVRSAEAPQRLLDQADLVVDGPRGLFDLLEELARLSAT